MIYKKSKKQKIIDFVTANPTMSRKEQAKACSVKLKYAYSILSEAGMTDKNHPGARKALKAKTTKQKQVAKKPTLLVTFSITGNTFVLSLNEAREVYNELKPLMEK